MSERKEGPAPPGLGLVGVDRDALEIATARMSDMIGAAADRALAPGVVEIEHQRRIHRKRRMHPARRLPGAIANARDIFALPAGRPERHDAAVDDEAVALASRAVEAHLQPLDRAVDIARRAASGGVLSQHVPRLERGAQLELNAAISHLSNERETELV